MGKPVRKTQKPGLPPPQKKVLECANGDGLKTRNRAGAHTATPHKNRMTTFYQRRFKEVLPRSEALVKRVRRIGSGGVVEL